MDIQPESYYASSDGYNNSFVGLYSKDSKICVNFPLGYKLSLDSVSRRTDVFTLNNLLKKQKLFLPIEYADEPTDSIPLDSYFFVIKDFLKNGYYLSRITNQKIATRGKINWKHTIKKIEPSILDDDFFYSKFIVNDSRLTDESYISIAYKYCLYQALQKIGWLWGNIKSEIPKNISIQACIRIINKELQKSFVDEKKELLLNLKNILNHHASSENSNTKISIGTDKFYLAWEYMVDRKFGDKNKQRDYAPQTNWKLEENDGIRKKPMRLDSICIKENTAWIFDAKYYRYGVTLDPAHLPETSSIAKQIIYGEQVNKDISHVYNVFIIPSEHIDEHYKYRGYATSTWKSETGRKIHDTILLISVDTKFLLNTYNNDNLQEREELLSFISSKYSQIVTV